MENLDIRMKAMNEDLRLYQIAGQIGVSEGCLSGKLRKPLAPEWRNKILVAIEELKQARKERECDQSSTLNT
jgi:hypothetical protein